MIDEIGRIRKLRRSNSEIGHAHELTFSCFHGLPLLNKDRTRQWFIESLDLARRQHHLELCAYVIMPEHAHVLILPIHEYDISAILKSIKQSVSRKAIHFYATKRPNGFPTSEFVGRLGESSIVLATRWWLRSKYVRAKGAMGLGRIYSQ